MSAKAPTDPPPKRCSRFVTGDGYDGPPPLPHWSVVDALDPTDASEPRSDNNYAPIEPTSIKGPGHGEENMDIPPDYKFPRLPSDDDPTWLGVEEEIRKDAYYMMGEPDLAALWATEPAEALIRAGERRARSEKKPRWVTTADALAKRFEIFITPGRVDQGGARGFLIYHYEEWWGSRLRDRVVKLFSKRS